MTYKATLEITGGEIGDNLRYEDFYSTKSEVEAETIGGAFDALVEKAYDMYFRLYLWLVKNRPADYSMEKGFWYVNCSFPSTLNPFEKDHNNGAGSSLQNPESLIKRSFSIGTCK